MNQIHDCFGLGNGKLQGLASFYDYYSFLREELLSNMVNLYLKQGVTLYSKYKYTLLILSGWSTRTKLYPSISSRLPGVVESTYVSDKHIKSYLYSEMYAFSCVSFE